MPPLDLSAPISQWLPLAVYVGYREGMPDVILGYLPDVISSDARYKAWICETPEEFAAVQKALSRPVPLGPNGEVDFASGPDAALSSRARGLPDVLAESGTATALLYPPTDRGWPWLIMIAGSRSPRAERGTYLWEVKMTEAEAIERMIGTFTPGTDVSFWTEDERN